eukprot:1197568-Amorphochlora_amoeboformis.AAC.1
MEMEKSRLDAEADGNAEPVGLAARRDTVFPLGSGGQVGGKGGAVREGTCGWANPTTVTRTTPTE